MLIVMNILNIYGGWGTTVKINEIFKTTLCG